MAAPTVEEQTITATTFNWIGMGPITGPWQAGVRYGWDCHYTGKASFNGPLVDAQGGSFTLAPSITVDHGIWRKAYKQLPDGTFSEMTLPTVFPLDPWTDGWESRAYAKSPSPSYNGTKEISVSVTHNESKDPNGSAIRIDPVSLVISADEVFPGFTGLWNNASAKLGFGGDATAGDKTANVTISVRGLSEANYNSNISLDPKTALSGLTNISKNPPKALLDLLSSATFSSEQSKIELKNIGRTWTFAMMRQKVRRCGQAPNIVETVLEDWMVMP